MKCDWLLSWLMSIQSSTASVNGRLPISWADQLNYGNIDRVVYDIGAVVARQKKRFIAGATCPKCDSMDTLMLFIENDVEQVECVKCKHRFSEPKQQGTGSEREFDQVIGVFKPE
ncbi:MAG: nucleic acid-binding protein [Idiomarina sp. T82-3]|nr:MAG: nucleic acid-binding protein [Idiomarina sp. T82-3]|tara:strand:+ start:63 stop:407 length:345 start_codon:yes stop_codon:yes gene_type:complete